MMPTDRRSQSAAKGHQARVEAIQYERRTRNWTPDLWRSDTPEGMHWPARVAQVQREADAAVDSLIAEVEAEYARLGR